METSKFILNEVFENNAKVYQTRPVKAMKYQPGMETGFVVMFGSVPTDTKELHTHEGMKFFDTELEAWNYINSNPDQYINVNGELVRVDVEYMKPQPILHRKVNNPKDRMGYVSCFEGKYALESNESEQYDFFYLTDDISDKPIWIIQDDAGNVRVWDSDFLVCSDETFFGNAEDIVCQKVDDKYIKVTV